MEIFSQDFPRKSKIVLLIPINLNNRQEITAALEHRYFTEYVFIGRIFQSTITHESCVIEISDRLNYIQSDFHEDLVHNFDLATLKKINDCPQVVCLTADDTKYNTCRVMAKFAQVFLQIGGVAIMVKSTGIAHQPDQWIANCNSDDVFAIYSLFVTLLEGESYYYSCGMHNFGKADTAISINEERGLAIYVMNVFNYYRLTESPILQDGHTFQPDIECPQYQIEWMIDQEYGVDSYQYNPYGRWHLNRV